MSEKYISKKELSKTKEEKGNSEDLLMNKKKN